MENFEAIVAVFVVISTIVNALTCIGVYLILTNTECNNMTLDNVEFILKKVLRKIQKNIYRKVKKSY